MITVFQVKLVVPQSTAAAIFGKGGERIARIQKESSARVHVEQKNDDSSLSERIVTVQGKCTVCLFVVMLSSHTHTDTHMHAQFYGPLGFCPGLPGLAGTRKVKRI